MVCNGKYIYNYNQILLCKGNELCIDIYYIQSLWKSTLR